MDIESVLKELHELFMKHETKTGHPPRSIRLPAAKWELFSAYCEVQCRKVKQDFSTCFYGISVRQADGDEIIIK